MLSTRARMTGTTRTAVALASVAALAFGSLALVAPASAETTPPPDEVVSQDAPVVAPVTGSITINKAGTREGNTANVSGLKDAVFEAYATTSTGTDITGLTSAGSCSTDGNGTCTIPGLAASRYVVVEKSAPGPWLALPDLSFTTNNGDGSKKPYRFNVDLRQGGQVTVPGGNRKWANAAENPEWPICGMDIAILLDTSGSISTAEWKDMKAAAAGFVTALEGTPSRVSVWKLSTNANGEATAGLRSVKSPEEAAQVIATINGVTKVSGSTNWDEGLAQIAASDLDFDTVLVLTDGNPTRSRVSGNGSSVILQNIEEAVHSANAVKAMAGTPRVIGVGIGLSGDAALNLAAISGPTVNSDYYLPADFVKLADTLKEIAAETCKGTVTVEKQIGDQITTNPPTEESNGWDFEATIDGSGAIDPASGTTDVVNGNNGQLQFALSGAQSWTVTVSEKNVKPGYSLKDVRCTYGGESEPIAVNVVDSGVTFPMTQDQSVQCVFLNSRDGGTLKIAKTLSDGGSGYSAPFDIGYECAMADAPSLEGKVTVPAGDSRSVSIPTGYTCTVSEDLPEAPSGYSWSKPSITGSPTTPIPKDGVTSVTVANTLTANGKPTPEPTPEPTPPVTPTPEATVEAVVEQPAVVTAAEPATAAEEPAMVTAPEAATIPQSVPAGDGSTADGTPNAWVLGLLALVSVGLMVVTGRRLAERKQ